MNHAERLQMLRNKTKRFIFFAVLAECLQTLRNKFKRFPILAISAKRLKHYETNPNVSPFQQFKTNV